MAADPDGDLTGVLTVVLPGTGSDEDYVGRAFAPALRQAGATMLFPAPDPSRLIGAALDALDRAAKAGPIAVGGVSIGAAVAAAWAIRHPGRAVGVLAALPPWTGRPADAPAALAARVTATQLRNGGLDAAIAALHTSGPRWLARELDRSWRAQWPGLPRAMDEAAGYAAPTAAELATLGIPLGVAAADDDPVHPVAVAQAWVAAAPRAALHRLTLDRLGADPAELGAAAVAALATAAGR